MHGFIRHAFGLASVLAVVLVDLVLKLAFPIRVVAHRSLPWSRMNEQGCAAAVERGRKIARTARPVAGAACVSRGSCIVAPNDGYAASLPEREQVRPGA